MAKKNSDKARVAIEKDAKVLCDLMVQMQSAINVTTQRPAVDWGDAEQMHDALKYTVYAAFAMGIVSEYESAKLGFPC